MVLCFPLAIGCSKRFRGHPSLAPAHTKARSGGSPRTDQAVSVSSVDSMKFVSLLAGDELRRSPWMTFGWQRSVRPQVRSVRCGPPACPQADGYCFDMGAARRASGSSFYFVRCIDAAIGHSRAKSRANRPCGAGTCSPVPTTVELLLSRYPAATRPLSMTPRCWKINGIEWPVRAEIAHRSDNSTLIGSSQYPGGPRYTHGSPTVRVNFALRTP